MPVFNNMLAGASGGAGGGGGASERSLRFNSTNDTFLSRTPGSAGDRTKWTWAAWVKRSKLDSLQSLFTAARSGNETLLTLDPSNRLEFYNWTGSYAGRRTSTAVFRDCSAWYHVVLVWDTGNSTPADRIKFIINGVRIETFTTSQDPNPSAQSTINDAYSHRIGDYADNPNYNFNGYLADVYFIDGQALDHLAFTEFDTNGVLQPKAYSGTYGTNGFHLDFKDNSSKAALGTDTSGNSNTWDVTNLTASSSGLISKVSGGNTATGNSVTELFNGTTSGDYVYPSANNDVTFTNFAISNARIYSFNGNYQSNYGNGKVYTNSTTTPVLTLPHDNQYQWYSLPADATLLYKFEGSSGAGNQIFATRAIESGGVILSDAPASNVDSLRDSPSQIADQTDSGIGGEIVGNYPTFNPLSQQYSSAAHVLRNGNLQVGDGTTSKGNYALEIATMAAPPSGKWYWEMTFDGANSNERRVVAVMNSDANFGQYIPHDNSADGFVGIWCETGQKIINGSRTSYASAIGDGDVVGVALDQNANTVNFYVNGTDKGSISLPSNMVGKSVLPAVSSIQAEENIIANFGQRAFAYQNAGTNRPSADFKCLNTANLTATIADGSQYFEAKKWDGNGASSRTIPTSFKPDLVWVKSRSLSGRSHYLYDSARGFGANKELVSNSGVQEGSSNHLTQNHGYVSGTTATGFTLTAGATNSTYTNDSGQSYIGWVWDAGTGTSVTNEIGTIDSQVCASAASGFSIVTWTGNGQSNASVGHSLNAAPGIVIIKNRDATTSYHTYVRALDATGRYQLYLDGNQASTDFGTPFFDADSTKINLIGGSSAGINASGDFVAWCFAPVESYQVMGSYIGNGNASGPFVFTGMRPRLVLIKRVSGGTASWCLYDSTRDTFNDATHVLCPDSNAAGNGNDAFVSDVSVDFLSNGFRIVDVDGEINGNTNEYIYLAIAEHPFKTARAR